MMQITQVTRLGENVAAITTTDDITGAKDTSFVVLTRSGELQVINRWTYRRIEDVYPGWQIAEGAEG